MKTLIRSFTLGVVAFASVLCFPKALATDVSGTLSSDTVWSASGSPYVVTGTVLVSSGVKLTVEAGVEVRFDSGKSLQVFGELVAQGSASSGITFTSAQDSKAEGDWGQIMFYDSSVDASFDGNGDYASGSILEYCTVEYGSGLLLSKGNPFINQSAIRYHSSRGIRVDSYDYNGTAVLKITNNTITNNRQRGIDWYWYSQGQGIISGNTISNNMGGGVSVSGSTTVVSGNTIEGNKAGRYEDYGDSVQFRLDGEGGGVKTGSSSIQILNNIINGNQAREGGGIKGQGTITGNTIINNYASSSGGGFYLGGHTNNDTPLSDNFILNNTANSGGGIYIEGSIGITGNVIAGNTSSNDGGAIYYRRGDSHNDDVFYISANTIFNNTGKSVIYHYCFSDDVLKVKNNVIVGNNATGSYVVQLSNHPSYGNGNILFNNNNIYDNGGTYELSNQSALGTADLNAESNYWGTSDASVIAAKVHDWNDDSSYGFVDYTPHETALITSNPIAPLFNVVKEETDGGVKISWTANGESDVSGYKVHYGSGTGYSYATAVDAGNVTSYEINGLSASGEVAVTAYDANADGTDDQIEGYESWFVVSGDAAAGIALSNTSLDFGVVATGSSQAKILTLTNSRSADLIVTGISSLNSQFSVSPSSVTLSAGSSQNVSITYTPSAVGSASSTLTISHNAGSGSSTTTLSAYASASSGTAVKGQISSDTTWSASGSPYVVTGSVLVSSGVKLTVEAGVEVRFDSGKSLQVFGELVAQGSASSGITFTSAQDSKAEGDWGQIMFYDSSVDASFDGNGDYASGSILEYCTVEYGSGLLLSKGNPFINQSAIRYHSSRGIRVDSYDYNGTAVLKITNNTITNNRQRGIDWYWYSQGQGIISGNTISNNMGGGVSVSGSTTVVSGNTIEGNKAGRYEDYGDSVQFRLDGEGGGVKTGSSSIQILNNIINGNQAREGGGIKGQGTITGNTIINNYASSSGGGFYLGGHTNNDTPLSDNFILNNTANSGGGIYIEGSIGITGNVIAGNTSSNDGGAIYYRRGDSHNDDVFYIFANTIFNNTGKSVIYHYCFSDDVLKVENNVIVGNNATGSYVVQLSNHPSYGNGNILFNNNNIYDNGGTYELSNQSALGTADLNAESNYWGASDASVIAAKVHDWNDDSSYGFVDYTPHETALITSNPIAPPSGVSGQTGPTTMQLSWTANSESDIAGYKVYYDTDGSVYPYANSVSTGSTGTTYTLTGLTTGTTYYAAVAAIDSDGNESWVSVEVSETPTSTPTDLALTAQPSNSSAGSPLATQPVVRVTDLEGNLVTSTSPSVTISITSGSGTSGATLLGTTTVNAVDGVATFSDLQINSAGSNYTLTVSSSGLTSLVSSAFDIAVGSASTLIVATNPSESAANDVFSTQPVVHITDGYGNIITTASGTVTVAIASGLGTLTGTEFVSASSGVATFTGLGIDTKGDDYQLAFSSPGLVSATSGAFNIISATPVSLSFKSNPTGGQAGEASALASTVLVLDKNGNQVVDSSAEITLQITDDTGNDEGELSGTVTLNATNGQAAFSDLAINRVGDSYSVTATSSGLVQATSSTFNITAGSPVALGFVTEPGGARTARQLETQPVVGFVDSQGNAVAVDDGISISIAIKSGTGSSAATLSGTTTISTSGGYAEFTDLKINRLGDDYQLVANANGYNSVESLPFAMTGLGQVTTAGMKGFTAINSKDRWAVGAAGEIIATTDGGKTWWSQNSPVSSDLYSVGFVNRHLGFAVGDGGVFLRTTNGGHSWVQRSIGTSVNLRRIKFYNPRKGIIAGEGGFIARTENRGLSWSIESSGVTENLHSVSYSSAQRAWAVGQSGRVMRTTNGGKTWSAQTSNTTRRLKSIHMQRGTNRGVAVGAEGRVIKTTDGGETWAEQTVSGGSVQDLNDVHFVNSTTGWAVGNGGTIMRTTDGGATWSGSNPVTADLHGVGFVDVSSGSSGSGRSISKMSTDYSGGIVGADGNILASEDSGGTWTSQNGIIDSDTVWSAAGSPYVVTGSVLVSSGVKLTVEAGVEVRFDSGKSLQVFGELVAQGSASSGITFTSAQDSKAEGDWGQIMFYDSSVDASFDGNGDYASGSILEYCTVEYGSGLLLSKGNPFINQSAIRYHSSRGIRVDSYDYNGTAVLKITNNTITNNRQRGIDWYWYSQGQGIISGNTISNNMGGGVSVSGSTTVVSGNTIEGNKAGRYEDYGDSVQFRLDGEGGGVKTGSSSIQILNNIINGNQAREGGGIKGQGTITGNTIINNYASSSGGGFYLGGHTNNDTPLSDNFILNNTANSGGGIYIEGSIGITGNVIAGNTSSNDGGAIYYRRGDSHNDDVFYISANTIFNNTGKSVIYHYCFSDDVLKVKNNVIVGNNATGSYVVQLSNHPSYGNGNILFNNNNIYDNGGTYELSNQSALGTADLNAESNYWGTSDASVIAAKVHDWNDDSSYGFVDYTPHETALITSNPIAPPSGVSGQTGPTTMQLSWTANSESDIAGYKVYYDTDGSGYPYANSVSTGSTGTTYTLTGLTTGTTYYVAVAAIDSDGNESWVSNEASASTQPGTPNSLSFQTQPGNGTVGSTLTSQPTVVINVSEGGQSGIATNPVTLSITSGSADLLGTTTVDAVNGAATFSNLSINQSGSSYTLTASSSGLASDVSTSFSVSAGAVSQIVVSTQPSEGPGADTFTTTPVISFSDAYGNLASSSATVTASIKSGTGNSNATLIGTTSISAVSGVAEFTDLGVDLAGTDYVLTFESSGFASVESAAFDVTDPLPYQLLFLEEPSGGFNKNYPSAANKVRIADKLGITVASATNEVTLSIKSGTGTAGAALTGTSVVTASGGLATFNQVAVDSGGTNYQLMASSSGLNSATTSAFNIEAPTTTTNSGGDYPSTTAATITTINAPLSALNSNGTIGITSTSRFPDTTPTLITSKQAPRGADPGRFAAGHEPVATDQSLTTSPDTSLNISLDVTDPKQMGLTLAITDFPDHGRIDSLIYKAVSDHSEAYFPLGIEFGDEITLGTGGRRLTDFQFEVWSVFQSSDTPKVVFKIYKNDGASIQGLLPSGTTAKTDQKYPGTVLFESDAVALSGGFQTVDIQNIDIDVPDKFTWVVKFTGMTGMSDSRAGLLIAADPVTGESYGDFWEKLNGEWKLYQVSSDPSLESQFSAVVHGYDNTSTSLTYVPDSGYTGSDSFSYKVTDWYNFSDTATVTLGVTTQPVANAGSDASSTVSSSVSLDGSSSSDSDGDSLTHSWVFSSVATGSSLSDSDITSANSATPSFTPDAGGSYVLELTVNDGNGGSSTDTVTVTVTKLSTSVTLTNTTKTYTGAALGVTATTGVGGLNVGIVYRDSNDVVVPSPTEPGTYTVTATINDVIYRGTQSGTLTIGKATAEVTLGSLTHTYDGTEKLASVTTTPSGLTVDLTYSQGATLVAPIAAVAAVAAAAEVLYVAGDTLPEGKMVGDVKTAAVAAVAAVTGVTGPSDAGTYTVTATVDDANYEGSKVAILTISASDGQGGFRPIANAGADVSTAYGLGAVSLDGSSSSDADGDLLNYSWAFSSVATGSSLSDSDITSANSATPSFTPDVVGSYVLEVAVNDGKGGSIDTVAVTVSKLSTSVTLTNTTKTYTGAALGVTATTGVGGLNVGIVYRDSNDVVVPSPTEPGTYTVTATINDVIYQGTASGTLTIGKATAEVTLGSLTHTYDGTEKLASVTTTPSGLTVDLTYSQGATLVAPIAAVAAVAAAAEVLYVAGDTLPEGKVVGDVKTAAVAAVAAAAEVLYVAGDTLPEGKMVGDVKTAAVAAVAAAAEVLYVAGDTLPEGKMVGDVKTAAVAAVAAVTGVTGPSDAGTYTVTATVDDANYEGSKVAILTISASDGQGGFRPIANAGADVSTAYGLGAVSLDGSSSSDADGDLLNYSWAFLSVATGSSLSDSDITSANSATPSFTPDVVGSYVLEVAVNDGKGGSIDTVAVTVSKLSTSVTLTNTTKTYTGAALGVTATTGVGGLNVGIVYRDSNDVVVPSPTEPGTYTVTATINDVIYQGTASGTLTIGKATAEVTLGSLTHTYDGREVGFRDNHSFGFDGRFDLQPGCYLGCAHCSSCSCGCCCRSFIRCRRYVARGQDGW